MELKPSSVFGEKDFSEIMQILREVDSLGHKIDFHISGGAAIILYRINEYRTTVDIDLVNELESTLKIELGAYNINNDARRVSILPDKYEERLVPVEGFNNIRVYTLSKSDLFILKTQRASEADGEDIKNLVRSMTKEERELTLKVGDEWRNNCFNKFAVENYDFFRRML